MTRWNRFKTWIGWYRPFGQPFSWWITAYTRFIYVPTLDLLCWLFGHQWVEFNEMTMKWCRRCHETDPSQESIRAERERRQKLSKESS